MIQHNLIDSAIMSRIVGMPVSRQDFVLREDRTKDLAPGVIWRRRRFQFMVEEPTGPRMEGLCINEITIDSHAHATISPRLAGEYPHLLDLKEVENAYWATTFAKGALRDNSAANVRQSRLYVNMAGVFFQDDAAQREKLLATLKRAQAAGNYDARYLDELDELDPQWVEHPAGGYDVARFLPAFPASRLVQSSSNILAATNAGYFLNFPEEYDDGVSALHQPLGGHMVKGRLLSPPWIARPGFIGFSDGTIVESIYGPEEIELLIDGLAPLRLHQGNFSTPVHGSVWRFFDQAEFPAPQGGAALFFTGTTLVGVEPARAKVTPPRGGVIVVLEGAHAEAVLGPNGGRRVSLRLSPRNGGTPEWMISAGPFLVRNSVAVPSDHMLAEPNAGEFRPMGPAPTRFPFDVNKTRAPRTGIGRTSNGGMKIVVVDGRRSGEHSCGVTLEGLANLMAWVGCDSAINLDGGGSSVMAIEGADQEDRLRENLPYCVVNIPSDDGGKERIVPIFVVVEGLDKQTK